MIMTLTEAGKELLRRLLTTPNGVLIFTRAELGNGCRQILDGVPLRLTKLVNSKGSCDIENVTWHERNAEIKCKFNSHDITEGFWIREAGIFAYATFYEKRGIETTVMRTTGEILLAYYAVAPETSKLDLEFFSKDVPYTYLTTMNVEMGEIDFKKGDDDLNDNE